MNTVVQGVFIFLFCAGFFIGGVMLFSFWSDWQHAKKMKKWKLSVEQLEKMNAFKQALPMLTPSKPAPPADFSMIEMTVAEFAEKNPVPAAFDASDLNQVLEATNIAIKKLFVQMAATSEIISHAGDSIQSNIAFNGENVYGVKITKYTISSGVAANNVYNDFSYKVPFGTYDPEHPGKDLPGIDGKDLSA